MPFKTIYLFTESTILNLTITGQKYQKSKGSVRVRIDLSYDERSSDTRKYTCLMFDFGID